jgi:ankyrin repeat protein
VKTKKTRAIKHKNRYDTAKITLNSAMPNNAKKAKKAKKPATSSAWDYFLLTGSTHKITALDKKDQGQTVFQRMPYLETLHPDACAHLEATVKNWDAEKKSTFLDQVNGKGLSPLGHAIEEGKEACIRILINLDSTLSCAMTNGNWLEKWLEHDLNADLLGVYLLNNSEEVLPAIHSLNPNTHNIFTYALAHNNEQLICQLLDHNIDPNFYCTPEHALLTQAIQKKLHNAVKAMVTRLHHESVQTCDSEDKTPLMHACLLGCEASVCAILQVHGGAEVCNRKKQTALHILAALAPADLPKNHKNLATLLIQSHNTVNLTDHEGNHVAMVAAQQGHDQLCLHLLQHLDNLHHRNHHGHTLLWLCALTFCAESSYQIIQYEKMLTDKPFPLLHTAAPAASALHQPVKTLNQQLSQIEKKLATSATEPAPKNFPKIESLSPISVCLLQLTYREEQEQGYQTLQNLFDFNPDQTPCEDDILLIALLANQYQIAGVLLSFGYTVSTTAKIVADQIVSQMVIRGITADMVPIFSVCHAVAKVKQGQDYFAQGHLQEALVLAHSLPIETFPIVWAQKYWQELGDYFLLMQLESHDYENTALSTYHCLRKGQLSAWVTLDQPRQQENTSSVMKDLVFSLFRIIEKQKMQDRCSVEQKKTLKKIGLDPDDPTPNISVLGPKISPKALLDNIPSKPIPEDPQAPEYRALLQYWQTLLHNLITKSASHEQQQQTAISSSSSLQELFVFLVHTQALKRTQHTDPNPADILQKLLLLHLSPDTPHQQSILASLPPYRHSTSTAPSQDVDTSTQAPTLPSLPLTGEAVITLACHISKNLNADAPECAQTLQKEVLSKLFEPTSPLHSHKNLCLWLTHQEPAFTCLTDPLQVKKVLHCMVNTRQTDTKRAADFTSVFDHLAPYLNEALLPHVADHPQLIAFLIQPEMHTILSTKQPSFSQVLQAFTAFARFTHSENASQQERAPAQHHDSVRAALNGALAKQAETTAQYQTAQKELAQAQNKQAHAEKKLEDMHTKYQQLDREVDTLKKEIIAASKAEQAQERASKKTQDAYKTLLLESQKQQNAHDKALTDTNSMLDEQLATIESLRKQVAQLTKQHDQQAKALQAHKKQQQEAKDLQQQTATQHIQDRNRLQLQLDEALAHNKTLLQKQDECDKELAAHKKQQQEAARQIDKDQETIANLKKQVLEATTHSQAPQEHHSAREQKLATHTQHPPQKQPLETSEQTKQAEEELQQLRNKLAEALAKIETLELESTQERSSTKSRRQGKQDHTPLSQRRGSTPYQRHAFWGVVNDLRDDIEKLKNDKPTPVCVVPPFFFPRNPYLPDYPTTGNVAPPVTQPYLQPQKPDIHSYMSPILTMLSSLCPTLTIMWKGNCVYEFIRRQSYGMPGEDLLDFIYRFQEDIDLDLVGSLEANTLLTFCQQNPQIDCTQDPNNPKRLTLHDHRSDLVYDITLHQSAVHHPPYPGNIVLLWDANQELWIASNPSSTQLQFLLGQESMALNEPQTCHYTLFWALHLAIKHRALHRPCATTQSYIINALNNRQPNCDPGKAVLNTLQFFEHTPYWVSALETLLTVKITTRDIAIPSRKPESTSESFVLAELLLPHNTDLAIPPSLQALGNVFIPDVENFLIYLKHLWQQTEHNQEVLSTKTIIDWENVAAYPQPQPKP